MFLVTLLKKKTRSEEPPAPEVEHAHLRHLQALRSVGRLAACGLLESQDQGIIVMLAESVEEAEALVRLDPLLLHHFCGEYKIAEILSPNREERPTRQRGDEAV